MAFSFQDSDFVSGDIPPEFVILRLMRNQTKLSHIAFLVPSVRESSATLRGLDFHICPDDQFKETLEIYVGETSFTARLLLMEAMQEGSYRRALEKRGPGLHHIAVDVLSIEDYLRELSGSGWLLQVNSIHTMRKLKTVYLARPGVATLIEVHEQKELSIEPHFISNFEIPFREPEMKLIEALGVEGLSQSSDEKFWLTCSGKRFSANSLWSGGQS